MPKVNHQKIHVPPIKPDSCVKCPFVGIIPEERREFGRKLTRICLATMKAMSKRSISIKESERAGTKHPHHRPCDTKWDTFSDLKDIAVSLKAYKECRIPYEQQLEYEIDFGDY